MAASKTGGMLRAAIAARCAAWNSLKAPACRGEFGSRGPSLATALPPAARGGRECWLPAKRCIGSRISCVDQQLAKTIEAVKEKNSKEKVTVYSRSWCPYCTDVKGLLDKLKVDYKAIDLDLVVEGDDIQDALFEITGSRTVPQVFVDGNFVGGCDDTFAAYSNGKLKEIFGSAGVTSTL